MTKKLVPIVLTPYQMKIFETNHRINMVTGAAGAGSTWGLYYRALKEALEGKLVTVICGNGEHVLMKAGGPVEQMLEVVNGFDPRLSAKSNIISVGEGKIKFISGLDSLEYSKGVSSDVVIFEHHVREDVLKYHLMRAKQIFIGMHFYNVMESTENHWLQSLGLVELDENGKPYKFADFVHHITETQDNGYKFKGWEEYHAQWKQPWCEHHYDMQKLLMSDFHLWNTEGLKTVLQMCES